MGADALLRRPPGAVRRLPRLPGGDVEGAPKPLPACTTPCRDGMEIDTTDEPSRRVATAVVELVLSELPEAPAPHTELAQVAARLEGRWAPPRWPGATHTTDHDERHPYLAFQHELCISCGRCVRACDEVQGAFALTATGRGFSANMTAGLDAVSATPPASRAAPAPTPARPTRSRRSHCWCWTATRSAVYR